MPGGPRRHMMGRMKVREAPVDRSRPGLRPAMPLTRLGSPSGLLGSKHGAAVTARKPKRRIRRQAVSTMLLLLCVSSRAQSEPLEYAFAHGVPTAMARSPGARIRLVGLVGEPRLRMPHGAACVAVSPRGDIVVAGGHGGKLRAWTTARWREVWRTEAPGSRRVITCVAFTPDGRRIVAGDDEGVIDVLDARTGAPQFTLRGGHESRITGLALVGSPAQLASVAAEGSVLLWTMGEGSGWHVIAGSSPSHRALVGLACGDRIAYGATGGTVKVWSAEKRRVTEEIQVGDAEILDLTTARGTSLLIISQAGGTLRTWDVAARVFLPRPERSRKRGQGLASDDTGERVACGSDHGVISVWSPGSEPVNRLFRGHSGPVGGVAWVPGTSIFVSAGSDGTVRPWDAASEEPSLFPPGILGDRVTVLAHGRESPVLVVGAQNGDLRGWNSATDSRAQLNGSFRGGVTALAVGDRGAWLAVCSKGDPLRIFSIGEEGLAQTMRLSGVGHRVEALAARPGYREFATGAEDGDLACWSYPHGRLLIERPLGHSIHHLCYTKDGAKLLAVGKRLSLLDRTRNEIVWSADGVPGTLSRAAFDGDESMILTSSVDDRGSSYSVWNVSNGSMMREWRAHGEEVAGLAACSPPSLFCSVAAPGILRLLDANRGSTIDSIPTLAEPTSLVTLGGIAYVGCRDGVVYVYEFAGP